mgnify:CR=1
MAGSHVEPARAGWSGTTLQRGGGESVHRTLATSAVLGGLLAFAGCGDGDVGEAGSAPDQAESEAGAAATEDA